MKPYTPAKERVKKPWYELIKEKTGRDPRVCTHCKLGTMRIVSVCEPAREGWGANTKNAGVKT